MAIIIVRNRQLKFNKINQIWKFHKRLAIKHSSDYKVEDTP